MIPAAGLAESEVFEWVAEHKALAWWLGTLSVVTFLATLIAVPVLLTRMPADHFVARKRWVERWPGRSPALHIALVTGKNVLGAVLTVAGIGMLVLPGQGLLSIVLGLVLIDFPGKHRLERWLIRRPSVHRSINWIRARRHRPPLRIPGPYGEDPGDRREPGDSEGPGDDA